MTKREKAGEGIAQRLLGDLSQVAQCYALGLVCGAGRVKPDGLRLRLRGNGQPLRAHLLLAASKTPGSLEWRRHSVVAPVAVAERVLALLGGVPGDWTSLRFPDLAGPRLSAFVRGLLDGGGRIRSARRAGLAVEFKVGEGRLRSGLLESLGVTPETENQLRVVLEGVAALDSLGLLYDELPLALMHARGWSERLPPLARKKHWRRYLRWCQRHEAEARAVRFALTRDQAVLPHKQRVSDSGYDLTLVSEVKQIGRVTLYGTGVTAEPPPGYYLDVVPRSSIIRSGYILANSVGIIDQAYRGEILVPLIKLDDSAPDLELPARVAQLIPRPILHFPVEEPQALSLTERGAKGFGSSG